MKHNLERTALLVIDVQVGLDDPSLGPRNNPHCEANVAALIAAWRSAGAPSGVRAARFGPLTALHPGHDSLFVLDAIDSFDLLDDDGSSFERRRAQ